MATNSLQLPGEYEKAAQEFEDLSKRGRLAGTYSGLSFSADGVLSITGTEFRFDTRLDWGRPPGGEGKFTNFPSNDKFGPYSYGSLFIYPNYSFDIKEEIRSEAKFYRKTRFLHITNGSGVTQKMLLLDDFSLTTNHSIPINPTSYWSYTYATLKTLVYTRRDYTFKFDIFSGIPPGYTEKPISLDPPLPPPPPPACDIKIQIDPSVSNGREYFCMSFAEYERLKTRFQTIETRLKELPP